MSDALKQAEALRIAQELPFVQMGTADWTLCDEAAAELRRQHAEIDALRNQRNMAVSMLAEWCRAVDKNGTGWDDWDEYYKDAAYRPGPLRELIDIELAAMENTK